MRDSACFLELLGLGPRRPAGHAARLTPCCSAPTAEAGSRRRSTAPSRSTPTPSSSSSRARAPGASPTTTRPTWPRSASAAQEAGIGAVLVHSLYLVNLATPERRLLRARASRRCAGRWTASCAIEADGVVLHVGSHQGAGLRGGHGARRAGARAGARAQLRHDLAADGEHRRRRRDDRPLDRRAGGDLRAARPPSRGSASVSTRATSTRPGRT